MAAAGTAVVLNKSETFSVAFPEIERTSSIAKPAVATHSRYQLRELTDHVIPHARLHSHGIGSVRALGGDRRDEVFHVASDSRHRVGAPVRQAILFEI